MTQTPSHIPAAPDRPEQAFGFLWSGRWWIASVTLLACLAGAIFAVQRGTLFRVKAVVLVERGGPLGLASTAGGDRELPRNYAATQAELLRSTPVLLTALDERGLRGSDVFGDTSNELAWLKRHLTVGVGNQDDLITVTLDSPAKAQACDVVNAVVDAYLEFRAGNRRETTSDVLEHLTGELDRYEAELRVEQQALVDFLQRNPGVRLQADLNVAATRLRQLHEALTETQLQAMDARSTWQAAGRLAETPGLLRQVPLLESGEGAIAPRGESEPSRELSELRAMRLELLARTTADLADRYRTLQAERQELLAKVTPEHPSVQRIDRDLAMLREQASAGDPTVELGRTIEALETRVHESEAEFASAFVEALEHRYERLLERSQELATEVEAQTGELLALEAKQAEYGMLETRLDRARKIADLLYQRIGELDIVQQLGESDASATDAMVFEYATPEGAIVASSKRAMVTVATVLGLVLGAIIAWFRSLLDQRLRTAEDLAELVPVLSTVPSFDVHPDGVLATWAEQDDFVESMHALRMALSHGTRRLGGKVVQIASAEADDGKTLVAAGLAIAFAKAGQRTLVVDADFHSPDQARLFGVGEAAGLVQLLEHGRLDLATLRTPLNGLYVLPCGPVPATLDELLAGRRLGVTLKELAKRFDLVVIDSAPLLGGHEAQAMAAASDETLLVARAGRTTRKAVRVATASIVSVGGRVVGGVLNRVPRSALRRAVSRGAVGPAEGERSDEMILVQ